MDDLLCYYDKMAVAPYNHSRMLDVHGHQPAEVMLALSLKAYRYLLLFFNQFVFIQSCN